MDLKVYLGVYFLILLSKKIPFFKSPLESLCLKTSIDLERKRDFDASAFFDVPSDSRTLSTNDKKRIKFKNSSVILFFLFLFNFSI